MSRSFPCFLAALLLASAARADEAPRLVPRATPALPYPAGESLAVDAVVAIVVAEDGSVEAAEVASLRPPDAPAAFAEAALATARAFSFEPVLVDGKPTRLRTELALHFEPPAAPGVSAPAPAADAPMKEPAAIPPPVVAEARVKSRRPDATVSEVHLHGPLLRDVPRRNAVEMLTSAPGILLTNHGGEGHAPAVFLRGFDAGEGQDLEFRMDGVPLNEVSNAHSHGYADGHFIIPELVDELRVVEGPFDPRQGDFAVAGTAEYHLGLHDRGLHLGGGLGNYGTRRAIALWGPEGEEDGTFAGVELKSSDGFGANRASAAASVMAQYETRFGDTTQLSVLAQSYAARFSAAGVLRNDDFLAGRLPCGPDTDSQFFCTYDANQGGASSRHGLSARLRRRFTGAVFDQQLFVHTRQLRLRENFTGYLYDLANQGGEQRGDGSEKVYGAVTTGLRGALRLRRTWWNEPQEIELGYLARHDSADSLSQRIRTQGGAPYKRDFDVGLGVTDIALYAAAQLKPTRSLALRGGLRAESFAFSVLDRNRPALDRDGVRLPTEWRDAFGWTVMPRASLQYTIFNGLDLMASAGLGARSSDASALSDGEFAPFHRVRAAEVGLLHELRGSEARWSVSSRLSTFATQVDQALVFDEVAARNVLAGPSNRFGAMGLARVGFGGWLDAQASATYAEAYRPPPDAAWWQLSAGERMPYVPRWVVRLDGSARGEAVVRDRTVTYGGGLGVTYVAPRPLPLGAFSDPIFTIDASVRARLAWLELGLSAQNLLDARYRLAEFNFASNFRGADAPASLRASRTFAAGPPRMVMLTATFHFAGSRTPDDDHHDLHEEDMK